MECDAGVFFLGHLQGELAVRQKDQSAILIIGQLPRFQKLKALEFLLISRLNPASLECLEWFVGAFGAILML